MTWNVTITVLTSVFGTTVLISALYFIHAYLVPHLRRPKERPEITLPYPQRRTNHGLQDSLYSLPSLNYIDPRNSLADTDLRSTRWSTNPQDLSRSASPVSLSLPRSPRMHFNTFSRESISSPIHRWNISVYSMNEPAVKSTPELQYIALAEIGRSQKPGVKPPALTLLSRKSQLHHDVSRSRSKSDTAVLSQEGLLACSHAALLGSVAAGDLSSPTTSNFSGTTLLSSPRTPQPRLETDSDSRKGECQSLAEHRRLKSVGQSARN